MFYKYILFNTICYERKKTENSPIKTKKLSIQAIFG